MFSASVKQGARVHKLPRGPGLALGGPAYAISIYSDEKI